MLSPSPVSPLASAIPAWPAYVCAGRSSGSGVCRSWWACAHSRAVRAAAARSSALAASAAVPSSATSSRIPGSQNCHHTSPASAAVAAASNIYRPLSSPRREDASTRATRAGVRNAGNTCPETSSAATATALWVWSNTTTASAMNPNHVPSRLTV